MARTREATEMLNVRTTPAQQSAIFAAANARGMTVSDLMREAIAYVLAEDEENELQGAASR